tara:strand:- start:37 stop:519 length:483 start_codon:yes stop_codon:yes gene_type:complete
MFSSKNTYYKTIGDIYYQNNNEDINNYDDDKYNLNLIYNTKTYSNSSNPEVWGPSFWFSLHNGSLHYPENPSDIVIKKMKGFILGIPYMLPCHDCAEHAKAYISYVYDELNIICSSRDNLFKFYVDFHNYVNKRKNKKIMSHEEAYKLYASGVKVTHLNY